MHPLISFTHPFWVDLVTAPTHTTGPNCQLDGDAQISHCLLVHPCPVALSRYSHPVIATAGGDASEFVLALNVASTSFGVYMDEYMVHSVFRAYFDEEAAAQVRHPTTCRSA